jgi:transposase
LAEGVTDPAAIATLADARLRATPEQLQDALGACQQLNPVFRRLIPMALLDEQIAQLEREAAHLMQAHQDAIQRLAEVPGLGPDSAIHLMAEIGATAAAFDSPKHLASWVGICPGNEESAGQSMSTRSPKGNKQVRRIRAQAAHAAVKTKGSIFHIKFQRFLSHMDYQKAIWATAHPLCRLVWLILHKGVSYEERGGEVSAKSRQTRTTRMIRELKKLGYHVEKPLSQRV